MSNTTDPWDFPCRKPSWLSTKLQHYGLGHEKYMWWCYDSVMNFGDWVGPELFKYRTGSYPRLMPVYRNRRNSTVLVTAGSILSDISVRDVAVVWGSGIMSENARFQAPREILAVRGPVSRQRCIDQGFPCPPVYGDPGILVPRIFPKNSRTPKYRLGVVPHFTDFDRAVELFRGQSEVLIVDVRQSVEKTVNQILQADLLISSSLHGLIVSHAYGKRCRWVKFLDRLAGDDVKFRDYFLSIGLQEAPAPVWISDSGTSLDTKLLMQDVPTYDISSMEDALWKCCPF